MVDPLSYFLFQPVLHTGVTKADVLYCLWDDAYKRTLAATRKQYPMWQQRVPSLAMYMVLYHIADAI